MIDLNKTIPENFFKVADRHRKHRALKFKQDGAYFSLTFNGLEERIKNFASALNQLGVRKKDKVAILSHNRPEWAIADIATMAIGAVTVPIHTTLSPKIVRHVLEHSEAKVVIVSDLSLLIKIFVFQRELDFLEKIIFLGDIDEESKKISEIEILDWEDVLELGKQKKVKLAAGNSDDICSIIYTSGTTGLPKGVQLTHKNFLSNVAATIKAVPIKEKDVLLSFLPLSHVLERMAGYYTPLLSGATIAYAESFKQLKVNLKEVRPTIMVAVPRVFEKMYDAVWDKIKSGGTMRKKIFHFAMRQKQTGFRHKVADAIVFKKIRKKMGGRLRFVVSGGASLDDKIAKFFFKMGLLIIEGYGLTETSPVLAANRENDYRFGTVGKAIDGVEIRIANDKEILAKGPNIMKGYYKNIDETESTIDSDGWLHTGDLGFIGEGGFLTIIGRKKEMIVTSGGKNVWPEAVEQELNIDRFINQSVVIGNNRKFMSALIVPDWIEIKGFLEEQKLPAKDPDDLIKDQKIIDLFHQRLENINHELPDYERVRNFRLLTDEFSQDKDEVTPTLKLRRHVIESHYQKEIEEMYN